MPSAVRQCPVTKKIAGMGWDFGLVLLSWESKGAPPECHVYPKKLGLIKGLCYGVHQDYCGNDPHHDEPT